MPTIQLPPKYVHIVAVIVASLTAIGSIIAVIEGALPKGSNISSGLAVGAGVLSQALIALKLVEARTSGVTTAINSSSAKLVSNKSGSPASVPEPVKESQPAVAPAPLPADDKVLGELDAVTEPTTSPTAGLAPTNG